MYIAGGDWDAVRTSAQGPEFALGQRGVGVTGNEYVYVGADEALTSGNAVLIHEDYGAEQVDNTSTAPGTGQGMPVGLCIATIAASGFGWVQIYGVGDVSLNVGTSCAVHTRLNGTATAGRLDDDGTAGAERIDRIVTTAAESGNAAACFLTYPFVGVTV